jgi:hypothetical protein
MADRLKDKGHWRSQLQVRLGANGVICPSLSQRHQDKENPDEID